MHAHPPSETDLKERGAFPPTRWSLVVTARGREENGAQAFEALGHLCRIYWYPLYAFARRQGWNVEDAQDLTQEFFARLIKKETLHEADRERGRLRTFLLSCFTYFLADARDQRNAWRRGGRTEIVTLEAEECYASEAGHELTPERLFNRRWALTLLQQALDALALERAESGREHEMQVLLGFLDASGASGGADYEKAAAELGWTVNATRVAVHRLRLRYRQVLHDQVAATLESENPAMVKEEMQALLAALA